MNNKEFITEFKKWRESNGLPRRDECREMYRKYCKELDTNPFVDDCGIWNYISGQPKPSMFLDSLFKKDSSITKDDVKPTSSASVVSEDEIRGIILKCTYEYIKANNRVPELRELNTGYNVKKHYSTEKELFEAVKDIYDVSEYVLNESLFTSEYHDELVKEVKKYKRFVITTAVVNKKANKQFLNSVKNYCNTNNALCLVLPCQDVYSRNKTFNYQMDPELKDFKFAYEDIYLNDNIYISNIRVSAKQINPHTGLSHMSVESSVVVGSTKQDLIFVPNTIEKTPRSIMCTGAITANDYSSDLYMSDRINRISELNHIVGAIIVEVVDSKLFNFRQIQAGPTGEIIDLGVIYNSDGSVGESTNVCAVLGDAHFPELEPGVFEENKQLLRKLNVKDVVLHDVISCTSISHHLAKKEISKAIVAQTYPISLQEEADICADKIMELLEIATGNIYLVNSNHHSHITSWLDSAIFISDPINKRLGLELAMKALDGDDPFKYLMLAKTDLRYLEQKDIDRIIFLEKFENKEINGVNISMHGHFAGNGSKGNLQAYYKSFTKSVSGHSHVAQIAKSAYSVGTMSTLTPNYVSIMSSWTHTSCVIYDDGQRQLINFIRNKDGKYIWKT